VSRSRCDTIVLVPVVTVTRRKLRLPPRAATELGSDEIGKAAALLGSPVVAAAPARWGFTNRTTLATLADGRRVAVQRLADRAAARRRLRLGAPLAARLAAAGVPAAALLGGDAAATPPYVVHAAVAGENGAEWLAGDRGAVRLARLMGALVARLAAVDARGLRLPAAWSDPGRLARASRGRLARVAPRLDAATVRALRAAIAGLEPLFAGRRPAFAHGDFAPVNVLVARRADGRGWTVAALLDLEWARLADPLLDVAWWGWVVRFHHPGRWPVVWPAFLAAAGAAGEAEREPAAFAARVRTLQLLRLLELAERSRAGADWIVRLAATAGW
jgi:aminoglycoside phosphotransferase (APT) family kinase protein